MGKKYIYLICFWVTYKKIFLRLLKEQNKIILKTSFHTYTHPAKLHTMFNVSGLKRNPVQDAQ